MSAEDDSTARDDRSGTTGEGKSVPVGTMVLFLLGCGVLVAAAMNISNLGPWGERYGEVWVFLGFFLVMSIGGRWFWAGIDAIVSALRSGKDD
ncbi:hypothetical protein [Gordonia malaquae]|uniref:hypothetical protein n=1 Tax=Gordonia malaquae TaxID=410332 RepID=UPI0030FE509F